MRNTHSPSGPKIATVAVATAVMMVLVWVIITFSRTDIDDPVTVTAIRLDRLRATVELIREPPETFEDVLNFLPVEDREELRVDGWGRQIRYRIQAGMHEFRSAGPDGIWGNSDDYIVRGPATTQ